MVDFTTYPAPLTLTSVLAATNLSDASTVYTSAVPVGSGSAPYEAEALGVDFVATFVQNDAIGNITASFQCSNDGLAWFTLVDPACTAPAVTTVPSMWHVPVGSRQWRFIRAGFICSGAQGVGTESTVAVRAKLTGLRSPYTKS